MASNLPFEYTPRISDIAEQVSAGTLAGPDLQRILEKRDQDLEDFLAKPSGGTAQSILQAFAFDANHGGTGTLTNQTDIVTISIPSDASFDYYVDWTIHGKVFNIGPDGGYLKGTGSFAEQAPGAGFERWGYETTMPDGVTSTNAPFNRLWLNGFGHRVEHVDPSLLGTTMHFLYGWEYWCDVGTSWQMTNCATFLLIAIPV